MALVVQKFGGTSVANKEKLFNVAKIVTKTKESGNDVVVVVSAQGDTTDVLIKKAYEINEYPSKREMEVLLSVGEQMSIALLAMAIEKLGQSVISLTGWQAGIKTDLSFGTAKIEEIVLDRLKLELDKKNVVIVAGFQGINSQGDITTLGRGGSDTTAVALASVLNADKCEIYTDVEGVFTADPQIIIGAKKLQTISYDEMLELASGGAAVLHNRSVEMAKKYNVKIDVKSSFKNVSGTLVKEGANVEKMLIRGIAKDSDVAEISLIQVENKIELMFNIFSLLSRENVNIDIITQTKNDKENVNISFTVTKSNLKTAIDILKQGKEIIGYDKLIYNNKLSKVSIVGTGMISNSGVASKMFEALYENGIEVELISTSEIKIAVLVDENEAQNAVRAIHDKFFISN